MTVAGLRVDVDTCRGTRHGVPALVGLLARRRCRASFFFSVGPDNMGRHLWRLANPLFLAKMLRTRAARLYGWDILFKGTFWPGPLIGRRGAAQIRQAAEAGHEIGLHAWDHHGWQVGVAGWDEQRARQEIERGGTMLAGIIGRWPECVAAPAWRVTPAVLRAREEFPFRYGSDCRGRSLFRPVVAGRPLSQPQVPTTLPTYDEMVGRECAPAEYYSSLLRKIRPDRLNVLTIHAEVEGMACRELFAAFLGQASRAGIEFLPLGELLGRGTVDEAGICRGEVAGRQGWLACQEQVGRKVE